MGEYDHSPPQNIRNRKTWKNEMQYLYISCLNVRTLLQDSRITELSCAIKETKWDVIGLCETRRDMEKIEEYNDFILYHSPGSNGRNGVGFFIKKALKTNIVSFQSFSDRVAMMEIRTSENIHWSFLQIYAPTETYTIEAVNSFYHTVDQALQSVKTKNIILMGDFNAQIGERQIGEEHALGKYSTGKRNRNGQKLMDFILEKNFTVSNSLFKRKNNKKWTWTSPNGLHKNEIDYILTNQASCVHNFDIINNINFETDHRMIRIKLAISQKQRSRVFVKEYQKHVKNLPKVLRENGMEMENKLMQCLYTSDSIQSQYDAVEHEIKEMINCLPKSKEKSKLVSTQTMELLEERKVLYKEKRTKQTRGKITQISKQINKSITRDRQNLRQNKLKTYIKKFGAVKKAYNELRDKKEWTEYLRDKSGKKLIKRPDIINEATQFYKNLYARDEPERTTHLNTPSTINDIAYSDTGSLQGILKSEVEHAIKTQKMDKTPGADNITNEVLKSFSETLQAPLQALFNNIMFEGLIPKQWCESTITLLHKKGIRDDLNNYRPISLMTNMYKIFSKLILNRLARPLDEQQPREQAGFRKNYSTIDHIHVVTQVIEKVKEYRKTLYICFIDYTKAFDSLKHDAIWTSLAVQGVEQQYIELLRNLYNNISAKVRLEREGSRFPIEKGVRQGDPLSPKIFSAVLESIFRNLDWDEKGIQIDGEYLSHLRFADDIAVFAESSTSLEVMINEVAIESKKVGLSLNASKTKIITNGNKKQVIVGTNVIEYVNDYVYLGQMVSFQKCTSNEVQRRIAIAWKRYWSLKEIMKNQEVDINIKKKLYEVTILPSLSYGCQCWSLKKEDESKLAICQRKMERSMLGIKLKDKIRNKKIRKKTKLRDVVEVIRSLKWNWAGHMCRMNSKFPDLTVRWAKRATEWIPRDMTRARGRPEKRWQDVFVKRAGPNWMTKARDRRLWKELGEAYAREATFNQEEED